ncbi:MAG: O-antigen ligase family protein [Acidobacteriota bacterium]
MTLLSERVLVAALAWGAFTFGGVYPWAYWPLAGLLGALGLHAVIVTRAWEDSRIRTLGLALLALALTVSLQLLALPHSLVSAWSPGYDRFFQDYILLYHPASLHASSISPKSTLTVLGLLTAFSLFLIGLTRTLRRLSLEGLVDQLMGLGLALAIVGIVQKALIDPEAPLVYGFWQPTQGGTPGMRTSTPFGPFINRNHFAGWMVMALPVVVGLSYGLLVSRRASSRGWAARMRWLTTVDASRFLMVAFSALLMGMSLVLTGSRSGIAAFGLAMLTFAVLVVRQAGDARTKGLMAGYVAIILVGAVAWGGTDATIGRFLLAREDTAGRLSAWQDTWRIFTDFPLSGTGMGTFGQAMVVYQTVGRPVMYAQAHNEYLQVLAEGGVLVVVPAVVLLVIFARMIWRRLAVSTDVPVAYWIRAGAVAGLVGIAAQSMVEFSLQMPGNTVLFLLLLAVALHRGALDHRRSGVRPTEQVLTHAHRV